MWPVSASRRQGIGFSPEIETAIPRLLITIYLVVARGLASRLRLKLSRKACKERCLCRRQGIGFSPEIETQKLAYDETLAWVSPGDWLLA